jgi:tetratricopeptide (TPR) repeat protein
MKYRKLQDALVEANKGIEFTSRTGFKPYLFSLISYKARIQIMLGDIQEAEKTLEYLNKFKSEINLAPYLESTYFLSQFIFDLLLLEESIKYHHSRDINKIRKKAYKIGRKTVKNSRKAAADRTEAFKLMGVYFWLLGSQDKALKWWRRSIKEGERLKAGVELSRAYMEIGNCLKEKKSRFDELNGITPQQYLDKARQMFEEMNLKRDLEKLEKTKFEI